MSTRTPVVLTCRECGARNYKTTRRTVRGQKGERVVLSLKKFCPTCAKHTLHVEGK